MDKKEMLEKGREIFILSKQLLDRDRPEPPIIARRIWIDKESIEIMDDNKESKQLTITFSDEDIDILVNEDGSLNAYQEKEFETSLEPISITAEILNRVIRAFDR